MPASLFGQRDFGGVLAWSGSRSLGPLAPLLMRVGPGRQSSLPLGPSNVSAASPGYRPRCRLTRSGKLLVAPRQGPAKVSASCCLGRTAAAIRARTLRSCARSGALPLSVNVRRDAHHRGINDLEGENGERRTCWRRARMELELRLRLLPPAAKTSET